MQGGSTRPGGTSVCAQEEGDAEGATRTLHGEPKKFI